VNKLSKTYRTLWNKQSIAGPTVPMFDVLQVLVNVAPPKPTRTLSEMERRALLQPGASGSPTTQTPTGFPDILTQASHPHDAHWTPPAAPTCAPCESHAGAVVRAKLQHGAGAGGDDFGHDGVAIAQTAVQMNHTGFQPQHLPPHHHQPGNVNDGMWDTATEELLLSLDREHLFPGLGGDPRLMVDLDSWVEAPLASPEMLSAASSVSALSRAGSLPKGEYRSDSTSVRLATIKQSPDMHGRVEHSLSADSVEDVCETISQMDTSAVHGLRQQDLSPEINITSCKSVGDLLVKGHGSLHVDTLDDLAKGSMNNLLPCESMDFNVPDATLEGDSNVNSFWPVAGDLGRDLRPHSSLQKTKSSPGTLVSNENNPVDNRSSDSSDNNDTDKQVDVDSETAQISERKILYISKPEKSNNDFEYERHSPDETTQHCYADPNTVYSGASIGYIPHHVFSTSSTVPPVYGQGQGGPNDEQPLTLGENNQNDIQDEQTCQNPNKKQFEKKLQYSLSESRLKGLSNQFQMKRSTEEGDIAHLQDTTEVFVSIPVKKRLVQRDTEPAFDARLLPPVDRTLTVVSEIEVEEGADLVRDDAENEDMGGVGSGGLCEQFGEDKLNSGENNDGLKDKRTSDDYYDAENYTLKSELNNDDNVNDFDNDVELSDRTALLGSNPSSQDEQVTLESQGHFQDEGHSMSDIQEEEVDARLFHSQSCHSTFASSASGESEQRLSLVSATSEELPIVETDV